MRYGGWTIFQSAGSCIHPFIRLRLLKYKFSRLFSSWWLMPIVTESIAFNQCYISYTCHAREHIETKSRWVYTYIGRDMGYQLQENGINAMYFNISRRGPQIVCRSFSQNVFFKIRIVSLNISYNGYISHIPGYQMIKFDCAGVLVSRHIGLQPYPSHPVSVNAFCFKALGLCKISIFAVPHHQPTASSYIKLLLDAFCTFLTTLMQHLTDSIAFCR